MHKTMRHMFRSDNKGKQEKVSSNELVLATMENMAVARMHLSMKHTAPRSTLIDTWAPARAQRQTRRPRCRSACVCSSAVYVYVSGSKQVRGRFRTAGTMIQDLKSENGTVPRRCQS
eukprot:5711662-Pleurochrysis_carterae.AAC.3